MRLHVFVLIAWSQEVKVEDCFEEGWDLGVGMNVGEARVTSLWDCFEICHNTRETLGCSHFTYMESAGMCWTKNSATPAVFQWGVTSASVNCMAKFLRPSTAPPHEAPYSEEDCVEYDVRYRSGDGVQLLETSTNYPVLGSGYADPVFCQLNCVADENCANWNWVYMPGKYSSESAESVDKAACNLFTGRLADNPLIFDTGVYTGGPRVCPGGKEDLIDMFKLDNDPKGVTIRINAGGPTLLRFSEEWSEDQYYIAGVPHGYTVDSYWSFAAMDPLVQTQRQNFTYDIPIPPDVGALLVRLKLYFSEIDINWRGGRIFGVELNEEIVFRDVDIFGMAEDLMEGVTEPYPGWSMLSESQGALGSIVVFDAGLLRIDSGKLIIKGLTQVNAPFISMLKLQLTKSLDAPAKIYREEMYFTLGEGPSATAVADSVSVRNAGNEALTLDPKLHPTVEGCIASAAPVVLRVNASSTIRVECRTKPQNLWLNLEIMEGTRLPVIVPHTSLPESNLYRASRLTCNDIDFGSAPPVSVGDPKSAFVTITAAAPQFGPFGRVLVYGAVVSYSSKTWQLEEHQKSPFQLGRSAITAEGFVAFEPPLELNSSDTTAGVLVRFKPDSVGYHKQTVVFVTSVGLVSSLLVGQCVDTTEPHYLHPVVHAEDLVVDYLQSGAVSVRLDGSYSHTHEPGQSVTEHVWSVDGEVIGHDDIIDVELKHGIHFWYLSIADSEGKTLSAIGSMRVDHPERVTGSINLVWRLDATSLGSHFESEAMNKQDSTSFGGLKPSWVFRSTDVIGYGFDPQTLSIDKSDGLARNVIVSTVGTWSQEPRSDVICDMWRIEDDGSSKLMLERGEAEPIGIRYLESVDGSQVEQAPAFCWRLPRGISTDKFEYRRKVVAPVARGVSLCLIIGADCSTLGGEEVYHNEEGLEVFVKAGVDQRATLDLNGGGRSSLSAIFLAPGDLKVVYIDESSQIIASAAAVLDPLTSELSYTRPAIKRERLAKTVVAVQTSNGSVGGSAVSIKALVDGAPPAIRFFDPVVLASIEDDWLGHPTQVEWGPDGRIYIATFEGVIHSIALDVEGIPDMSSRLTYPIIAESFPNDDKEGVAVSGGTVGNYGVGPDGILGMAFDPFSDPEHPHLYVAHSVMFAQGGSCFDFEAVHAAFAARISRLEGPLYDTLYPVLENMAISNHDHGVNGMSFDNDGRLMFLQGVSTNYGWPTCILGGLPESHFTGALNRLDLRESWSRAIDYIDYYTGEFDAVPNQVIGDTYDVAPWVKGLDTYSEGLRNAFDFVFTTEGRVIVTQNGFNEGYGALVDGKPENCIFRSWDEIVGGWRNPFHERFEDEDHGKHCRPPVRREFSEPDRIFETFPGAYHGTPNPPYARNKAKDRNWIAKDSFAPNDPPNFIQGSAEAPSVVGITEWRGNCFKGQLRGDLIFQKWNGVLRRISLRESPPVRSDISDLLVNFQGLDIQFGPACSLFGSDFTGQRLQWIRADCEVTEETIFDVTPWRGSPRFRQWLMVGGNFRSSFVSAEVGGVKASVEHQSDKMIVLRTEPQSEEQIAQLSGDLSSVRLLTGSDDMLELSSAFLWRDVPPASEVPAARGLEGYRPHPGDERLFPLYSDIGSRRCFVRNANISGTSTWIAALSPGGCQELCREDDDCLYFSYNVSGSCNLFTEVVEATVVNPHLELGTTFGPKACMELTTTTTTTTNTTTVATTTTELTTTSTIVSETATDTSKDATEASQPEMLSTISTGGGTTATTTSTSPIDSTSRGGVLGRDATIGVVSGVGTFAVVGAAASGAIFLRRKKARGGDSISHDGSARMEAITPVAATAVTGSPRYRG